MLATLLANANRNTETKPEPFQPSDFFPSLADRTAPAASETAEPDDLRIAASLMGWGRHGRNLYRAGLGLPATG